MVIMSIDEVKEADEQEIKYIAIGDKIYAIALISLLLHKHKYKIRYGDLTITQEHLDSMPPPFRPYKHIDWAFLQSTPVVMFESVIDDNRYMRFDGRHRIWRAHELGFTQVPAMWVSREVWGCFIVGQKVLKDRPLDRLGDETLPRWEYVPYSWEESPVRPSSRRLEDDVHFEPNFALPDFVSSLDPNRCRSLPAYGLDKDVFDKLGHTGREALRDALYGDS